MSSAPPPTRRSPAPWPRHARVKTGTKLEDIFAQIQSGQKASVNLILKADVQGSLEAVTESLRRLERDEVDIWLSAAPGVGTMFCTMRPPCSGT